MRQNVYIISEGGSLGKKGDAFVFSRYDETQRVIFPHKTDALIIAGKVTISGDAFNLLARNNINVFFLAPSGMLRGSLVFEKTKNVFLRQKQFALVWNEPEKLSIAKAIVIGKLKNQLGFIQRIKRKKKLRHHEQTAAAIKLLITKAEHSATLDELRGYEGLGAKKYFSVFSDNIIPEWAEFKTRSKNPPRSNVNSVLSFLYTLLLYRVETALELAGLDPMVGFFHALEYGKNALAFDMMEELRAPLADTVCCSLFNLGILKPDDFETKSNVEPQEEQSNTYKGACYGGAVYLKRDGLSKVIEQFEKKLETSIDSPDAKAKTTYTHIILSQAQQIRRVINGEQKEYKAFLFR